MQRPHYKNAPSRAPREGDGGELVSRVTPWRSAAERLTHRLVLRRRLPPSFDAACIYTSSEGGLRYLKPTLTSVDSPLLNLVAELVKRSRRHWESYSKPGDREEEQPTSGNVSVAVSGVGTAVVGVKNPP